MVVFSVPQPQFIYLPLPTGAGAKAEQKCTHRSEQICVTIFPHEEHESVPTGFDLTLLLSSQRKCREGNVFSHLRNNKVGHINLCPAPPNSKPESLFEPQETDHT